jgi:hypothetical protein
MLQTLVVLLQRHNQLDMPVDIVAEHLALAGIHMVHALDMLGLQMVVAGSMRMR